MSTLAHVRMFITRLFVWRHFLKSAKSPQYVQEALLRKILSDNQYTGYGKKHGFSRFSSCGQFFSRVPIVTYEELRPYIEEQLTKNVSALTAESAVYYATTSGTTGKPKYIPLIKDELRCLRRYADLVAYSHYRWEPKSFSGKLCVISSPAEEGHFANGIAWGSVSGLLYAGIPRLVASKYVIPPEIFGIEDHEVKYRVILRLMLAERDITYMNAPNPTTFLKLHALANELGRELIQEIGSGGFAAESLLSPIVRRALHGRYAANTARAKELAEVYAMKEKISLVDLWPSLSAVATWTAGSCSVATEALRVASGPTVKIIELGYQCSEFRGTVTLDPMTGEGLPMIEDYYFEFIEPETWDNGGRDCKRIHQLQQGRDYYVIVTTRSGLYRYFINDIVRVVGKCHATPTIRFLQKGKGVTNITGEKLYESQFVEAVRNTERYFGFRTIFSLGLADVKDQVYRAYLETASSSVSPKDIAHYLDRMLMELNHEYRAKRNSGRLHPLELGLLSPNTGNAYRAHCVSMGQKDGQFKAMLLQYVERCEFPFSSYILKTDQI
ncbi:MAG: GH3 auxin-responsive promoter family protein [Gammaproteobacteria bacterium]|nr:GH3 auxin-responsive promoter family protein [Gammaproteobacteria bacterium]